MEVWTVWWAWAALALILAILEVLAPGYIFLGFAIGAGVLALALGLGLGPWGFAVSLVIFALLSLIAFVILRRVFKLKRGQVKIWKDDING